MTPRTTAGRVRRRGDYLLLSTPERAAVVWVDDYRDLLNGRLSRSDIEVQDAHHALVGHATIAGDALHIEWGGGHYHAWTSDLRALLERRRESIGLGLLTPEYANTVPALASGPLHA